MLDKLITITIEAPRSFFTYSSMDLFLAYSILFGPISARMPFSPELSLYGDTIMEQFEAASIGFS